LVGRQAMLGIQLKMIAKLEQQQPHRDQKFYFYVIQIPMQFTTAESVEKDIKAIVDGFPSTHQPNGARKIKIVVGLNVREDRDRTAMDQFCENKKFGPGVETVSFIWKSSEKSSDEKVNYSSIRNQLLSKSHESIRKFIAEAGKCENAEVELVTIDPDSQISEEWLQRSEAYWASCREQKQEHPMVTAAHYHFKISQPSKESEKAYWADLFATISNDHDPLIKQAIGSQIFLNYKMGCRNEIDRQSNLKLLHEIKSGLEMEPEPDRAVAVAIGELIAAYKQEPFSDQTVKDVEQKHGPLIQVLETKVLGESLLYPSEAFLQFHVFERQKNKTIRWVQRFKENFWGLEGGSEGLQALIHFTYGQKGRAIGFIPSPPFISEMPLRHRTNKIETVA